MRDVLQARFSKNLDLNRVQAIKVFAMSKIEQLPLLKEIEREPVPKLRRYTCPRCGDETWSELLLSAIYCPRCKRWFIPDRDNGA